jgi:hypothetical protein
MYGKDTGIKRLGERIRKKQIRLERERKERKRGQEEKNGQLSVRKTVQKEGETQCREDKRTWAKERKKDKEGKEEKKVQEKGRKTG